jgi:hypothetical protein
MGQVGGGGGCGPINYKLELRVANERIATLTAERDRARAALSLAKEAGHFYLRKAADAGILRNSAESELSTMRERAEGAEYVGSLYRSRLDELEPIASYPGHYVSSSCQAGLHGQCRCVSKYGEQCQCSCGHTDASTKPTYRELERELAEIKEKQEWGVECLTGNLSRKGNVLTALDEADASRIESRFPDEYRAVSRRAPGPWVTKEDS